MTNNLNTDKLNDTKITNSNNNKHTNSNAIDNDNQNHTHSNNSINNQHTVDAKVQGHVFVCQQSGT
jgi:hypothetical protein